MSIPLAQFSLSQDQANPHQSEQFNALLAAESQAVGFADQFAVLQGYDQFLRQYPDCVAAYQNRSALLQQLGLYQLAWRDAEQVERLAPDFALGHCNKAFLLNLFGHYAEGWAEYEWRWKTDVPTFADLGWPIPRWQGEPIEDGQRLLIHAEQGFGDNIQFVRLAIAAKQLGLPVVVVNHSAAENLLNANLARYGVETAKNGGEISQLQCHCPMMSLPHRLGLTLDNIPLADGYLQAETEFVAKWQAKLTACLLKSLLKPSQKRINIGVVWAGSPKHHRNAIRSLQFEQFARLFALNANFHCLQKVVSEADQLAAQKIPNLHLWQHDLHDFSDTAGLIAQLDLVISVDTAVAHLAAAMGKPTWILLSYHPDFRWLLARNDSPWYRSVRLFRQNAERNWQIVVQQLEQQLTAFIQETDNV